MYEPKMFDRQELALIAGRATTLAASDDLCGVLKRALQYLADAADYVDALLARDELITYDPRE